MSGDPIKAEDHRWLIPLYLKELRGRGEDDAADRLVEALGHIPDTFGMSLRPEGSKPSDDDC